MVFNFRNRAADSQVNESYADANARSITLAASAADMPVHTLRLPVDRMHQEHRVARGRGELRIDKGRDQFEFLDQRTDDQILSARRELVDNLESESALLQAPVPDLRA